MKETHPASVRSLLLSALILSSFTFQAQAYYHPEEGRWISRDPLGDEAFLSLHRQGRSFQEQAELLEESKRPPYLFLQNSPANAVDPLGLQGCCGPEVSSAIYGTLRDIEAKYRGWSFDEKALKCQALITIPVALWAWDVEELLQIRNYNGFGAGTQLGTGRHCEDTVAFSPVPGRGAKCFRASSVAYLAFGRMASLCNGTFPPSTAPLFNFDLPSMRTMVSAYKTAWYVNASLQWRLGSAVRASRQAVFFTESGHRGAFVIADWGSVPTESQCTVVNGNTCPLSQLSWTWIDMGNYLPFGLDPGIPDFF